MPGVTSSALMVPLLMFHVEQDRRVWDQCRDTGLQASRVAVRGPVSGWNRGATPQAFRLRRVPLRMRPQ